jgi:hypothetical protein
MNMRGTYMEVKHIDVEIKNLPPIFIEAMHKMKPENKNQIKISSFG